MERLRVILWYLQDLWRGNLLGGATRSSKWPAFRKLHIKDRCESCGKKGTLLSPLELHHIELFSQNPARECDPTNVLTGCRRCHQLIYHLDNFKSWDVNARESAAKMLTKIKTRPEPNK